MKFEPIKSEKQLQALADEFFNGIRKDQRRERREQMKGPTLTMTIRRVPFADIVGGFKKIEYREMTPYWERRLDGFIPPFNLRLINGMSTKAPELTVRVVKVRENKKTKQYELQLGKILVVKNWNVKKSIVDTISITGRRGLKVVEYTKEYVLLYKKKPVLRSIKTSSPDASINTMKRKFMKFIKDAA